MIKVFELINETSLHDRTQVIENRNKDRDTYVRIFLTYLQKIAPVKQMM